MIKLSTVLQWKEARIYRQCVKEVITVINLFMNSHDYYN